MWSNWHDARLLTGTVQVRILPSQPDFRCGAVRESSQLPGRTEDSIAGSSTGRTAAVEAGAVVKALVARQLAAKRPAVGREGHDAGGDVHRRALVEPRETLLRGVDERREVEVVAAGLHGGHIEVRRQRAHVELGAVLAVNADEQAAVFRPAINAMVAVTKTGAEAVHGMVGVRLCGEINMTQSDGGQRGVGKPGDEMRPRASGIHEDGRVEFTLGRLHTSRLIALEQHAGDGANGLVTHALVASDFMISTG